jgi:hypothetical protein
MANGLVTANQFQLTPDIAGSISRGLKVGSQFRQAQLQPKIQDLRTRASQGDQAALNELAGIAPAEATKIQQFQAGEAQRQQGISENRIKSVVEGALQVKNLPDDRSRLNFLKQRRIDLQEQAETDPSISTVDTDELINLYESGKIEEANALIDSVVNTGIQFGVIKAPTTKPQELEIERDKLTQRQTEQQFKEEQAEIKAGQLSATVQKILNTSQDEAFEAGKRSRSLSVLATDVNNLDIGGGLASTFSESIKAILGSQDDVSDLRRRFNAVRASQSVQNLPPGPASDKDIALALSGFPRENASGQQIVSFLKGAAKLEGINAAFQNFKSNLISETGGTKNLIKKWKTKVNSPVLGRDITTSELFITAQEEGITVEELKQQLGVE